jgi:hypothetical protein
VTHISRVNWESLLIYRRCQIRITTPIVGLIPELALQLIRF